MTNGEPVFGKNEDNPLNADVIIIDEMSMTDIFLMSRFLEAVPFGCRLVMVGDSNQLPSVGPGAVLSDMLRSRIIPAIALTDVFRQAEDSSIAKNAQDINYGRLPKFNDTDFVFKEINDPSAITAEIVRMCKEVFPSQGFSPYTDIQVLSPMHRTECGVTRLNSLLQKALNPTAANKDETSIGKQVFRCGDKVMQLRNNYIKGVFNGDIGFITQADGERIVVSFGEHTAVTYEKNDIGELTLAYAISVHKSQGSEYPIVILPMVRAHYIMLQRNLLYTAVTRAKKAVIIIGERAAFNTALMNDRERKRYTLLTERIIEKGADK